jgi:hypothetical protein
MGVLAEDMPGRRLRLNLEWDGEIAFGNANSD